MRPAASRTASHGMDSHDVWSLSVSPGLTISHQGWEYCMKMLSIFMSIYMSHVASPIAKHSLDIGTFRCHHWSPMMTHQSRGGMQDQKTFCVFLICVRWLDKPACLAIRFLWFLFLIAEAHQRFCTRSQRVAATVSLLVKSEVKKQIGRQWHCLALTQVSIYE